MSSDSKFRGRAPRRAAAVGLIAAVAAWAGCRPRDRVNAAPAHLAVAPAVSDDVPRQPADAGALRVCADPNNMPFTNERGEGFENAVAGLLAQEMGVPLEYFWQPQRRGFVRTTLAAGRCDAIMGVPAGLDRVLTTRPYYRSAYAFITRRDRGLAIRSFDDPRLRFLRIGIQVTGEDYENPPAALALAARRLSDHVSGYTVYGDYSRPAPLRAAVEAVARGEVDVSVVWGPPAGYFAARSTVPLRIEPVVPQQDPSGATFAFDIAVCVRRGDRPLREAIDRALGRRAPEIQRLLKRFGVPIVRGGRS